ncbi:FAD-dependent oxidoreductase [soil metagenome]
MPYYIGGLAEFRERGIDARTGHEVETIDLDSRTVAVREGRTGRSSHESFDHLVIATGAEPVRPDVPGVDAGGIHEMSSMRDMLAVEAFLARHECNRAVVVGGGYIGLEMAEAFLLRGIDVALIHSRPAIMPNLDEDMGLLVNDALVDAGVQLITGQPATGFEQQDGQVTAVLTDDAAIPADIVVVGIGTRPRSDLASAYGIPTGPTGGIIVDERMRTSVEGVWAAGDCTEMHDLMSGEPVSFALGTIANKQGRICGINLAGGNARFPGVLGTAITRFQDTEISRTGLSEGQLQEQGTDYVAGRIGSSARSGYYPGSSKITVKVTASRQTGKLLGAQIVGGPGSGKRIDTIATALAAGLSVADLEYLDLSYAPPFSPVWDPVQIAARIAGQRL